MIRGVFSNGWGGGSGRWGKGEWKKSGGELGFLEWVKRRK